MRQNAGDYPGVRALAASLGVECSIDPTITPKMDGDTSIVSLRMGVPQMLQVFTDRSLVGEGFCAPPAADRRGDAGRAAVQRRPHRVLHLSVRRRLSVRPVSLPSGNLRQPTLRRGLARLAATSRGADDSDARSPDMFVVQLHDQLHALSGAGVYGRQHARAIVGGLREIDAARWRRASCWRLSPVRLVQ